MTLMEFIEALARSAEKALFFAYEDLLTFLVKNIYNYQGT